MCLCIILQCYLWLLTTQKENNMCLFLHSIESHYVKYLALILCIPSWTQTLNCSAFVFSVLELEHTLPPLHYLLLNCYFNVSLPSLLWWKLSAICILLTFWELMHTHANRAAHVYLCGVLPNPTQCLSVIICNQFFLGKYFHKISCDFAALYNIKWSLNNVLQYTYLVPSSFTIDIP